MSMIPGGGSQDFYDSIPSGPKTDPYSKGGSLDPGRRSKRYSRFGDALKAASAYKEKAKAEKEAGVEMGDEDDDKGTKGFKISPDATVIEGYRSPPFRVDAPKGGGILGPLGGALSTFFPVTGGIVSAAGSLTGY